MAGHSKWHNIKRRKEAQDNKRAKMFTKYSKEIYAAVRESGDDPETNLRLRHALNKAKAANMPNDNIERTIKKANGEAGSVEYEELTYEGYGPGGAAVMVKVLTENRNRTVAEVRQAFNKNGGNMGEDGCVSFMFDKRGFLEIADEDKELDEDELMLEAVEAGAEEFEMNDGRAIVYTEPGHFEMVRNHLTEAGYEFEAAEVTMIPQTYTKLSDEHAEQMMKLIDQLEDDDDVQNVYHNFELTEDQAEHFTPA
ncbi:YebC/PmpR family DNA-binding regulatory protein [Salsuginibacillus halophilus]|uniref:Probable transcriptional regulatory protein B0H94_107131 n=1 Tax=Salsuginibacillus halophilus TaxID=517424 RepID=A0A2P8HFZ9_9BACI|nr:YebC/PmpR family DNA-binding transcriptional regulator [Salsuginibacillus halophilus]PSL45126.1 YebC/PmpR family DNA-binding regulatory protein [Salsuginibacillus halophilus]